jgi:hypothetical protein
VLQSTFARFDPGRIVEGFRRAEGDELADFVTTATGTEPPQRGLDPEIAPDA